MFELFKDNRGQAESVFRLMIDSAIGLAILIIIISSLSQFDRLSLNQSVSDFRDLVVSSSQSPDGQVFNSKELTFAQGQTFSTLDLESWTNISEKCFEFDSVAKASMNVSDGRDVAEFLSRFNVKVSAKCVSRSCDPTNQADKSNCCVCCKVLFGKVLTADDSINCPRN
ncbi:Uncharacterised protein [uncultured archaeon]|nr:Uncharacterised protein [uncultured archaeon]